MYVLHPEEALADAQKYLRDQAAESTADTSAEQESLRQQFGEWRAREERQKELFRAGIASLAETEKVVGGAQTQVALLEADLAGARGTGHAEAQVAGFAADLDIPAARLDEVERVGDRQAQRQIIETLIARVVVTTTGEAHYKEAKVDVVPNLGGPVRLASQSAPGSPEGLVWSNRGTRPSGH